jgi:hypothetical protein
MSREREDTSASSVIAIRSEREETFNLKTISLSKRTTFRSSSSDSPGIFPGLPKINLNVDFASLSQCVQCHVRQEGGGDEEAYLVMVLLLEDCCWFWQCRDGEAEGEGEED